MNEKHLSEETLAAMAEGHGLGAEEQAAREHLARCRSCHAAYADAVRFRAQWLANPGRFRAVQGSVEEGLAVRVKQPGRAAMPEPVGVPIRRRLPLLLRPLPAALAGAALLGLLSILVVSSPFWNQTNPGLRDSIAAIEPMLATSLDRGLVLPGTPDAQASLYLDTPGSGSGPGSGPGSGSGSGPGPGSGPGSGTGSGSGPGSGPGSTPGGGASPGSHPTYRNGAGAEESVARAVKTLAQQYQEGDRSAETAYWLITGYLVTGQIQSARVIAAEARRLHPDDPRLRVAQGVLAYRESNLPLAIDLFEEALFLDPRQPEAMFNRGMVRLELGDLEGARQDLHTVALREADQALGRRASLELEAIGRIESR